MAWILAQAIRGSLAMLTWVSKSAEFYPTGYCDWGMNNNKLSWLLLICGYANFGNFLLIVGSFSSRKSKSKVRSYKSEIKESHSSKI